MTDATLAVTRSAIEAFAREYLNTLGASIREEGTEWHVRLPDHVEVSFGEGQEFDIRLGDGASDDELSLAPDSDFTNQLLEEAATVAPVGEISITDDFLDVDYQYPDWITESDVDVSAATFDPYYDRNAVFVVVKVGVETVSEYQTQFLEAVTIDASSQEPLPELSNHLLEIFFEPTRQAPRQGGPGTNGEKSTLESNTFESVLEQGQQSALIGVQDQIGEIRESASRAADSEFQEYRQLQEQRLSNLREEIESVTNRLQEIGGDADRSESHQQRVDALQKREEFRSEKEELEEHRDEVIEEKQRGYEAKRQEIYQRHSLKITTTPVAATVVSYERGEIELIVTNDGRTDTLRAPYAVGVGITDAVDCEKCGAELSPDNPLALSPTGVGCISCTH